MIKRSWQHVRREGDFKTNLKWKEAVVMSTIDSFIFPLNPSLFDVFFVFKNPKGSDGLIRIWNSGSLSPLNGLLDPQQSAGGNELFAEA